jgi:MoaA/NifB/PqqE/SkfB family radical SAM enzyme
MGEIALLAEERLRPLVLHVTSNGWFTDRLAAFCEDRRRKVPLQLLLSIDGLEETHNRVRGNRYAWQRVMETVRLLAPRQKALRLSLAVNQTIVDAAGLEQYRLLHEMLRPLGIVHRVVVAYAASATYHQDRGIDLAPGEAGQFTPFGQLDRAALQAFFERAERDLGQFAFAQRLAARYYLAGIRQRLLHGVAVPNPPCAALGAHLRIFPDGDVPTCQFNSRIVGNLRRQSFREIWEGPAAAAQRSWVHACAGCWAECEVLPSAIYSLDLLRSVAPQPRREAVSQAS